jgi:hypothetical protein
MGVVHSSSRVVRSRCVDPYVFNALEELEAAGESVRPGDDFLRAVASPEIEEIAIMKFSKRQFVPTQQTIDDMFLACQWIIHDLAPFIYKPGYRSPVRVLSDMNLQTSPGWPWRNFYDTKEDVIYDDRFAAYFEKYWLSYYTGTPCWNFVQCIMKAEMLPILSLLRLKHRMVGCAPIEHVIMSNCFEADFNTQFCKNTAGLTGICISQPLVRGGAEEIILRLEKHPLCDEYDISQNDVTYWLFIQFFTFLILHSFIDPQLTPSSRRAWDKLMWSGCKNFLVLADGRVFWNHGLQISGENKTIVKNTLESMQRLATCFIALYRKANGYGPSFVHFKTLIEYVTVGDDLNVSRSLEAPFMDSYSVTLYYFNELGQILTNPHDESKPARDLTFLSQSFHQIDGKLLPFLDRLKMKGSILYNNERPEVLHTLARLCNIRVVTWPDEVMRNYVAIVYNKIYRKYFLTFTGSPEWDMLDAMWVPDVELRTLWLGKD